MNRFVLPLVGFVIFAGVMAIALKRAPEKGDVFRKSALIGKPAPEFSLPNLTQPGEKVDFARFKGQWVLLNVWGTWCYECRAEHPMLLDIQRQGRVKMVGLNYKDDDAAAVAWLAELGNPYEVVAADREGRAAIEWGVYGAPETFLVNPQGTIVHKRVSAVTQEVWDKEFLPLIDAAPAARAGK